MDVITAKVMFFIFRQQGIRETRTTTVTDELVLKSVLKICQKFRYM